MVAELHGQVLCEILADSVISHVSCLPSSGPCQSPLMLLSWVSWAYNVPEGLAVPLARINGGGSVARSASSWPQWRWVHRWARSP